MPFQLYILFISSLIKWPNVNFEKGPQDFVDWLIKVQIQIPDHLIINTIENKEVWELIFSTVHQNINVHQALKFLYMWKSQFCSNSIWNKY